jgi:major membrane immunogen (membrane-anchored lipoprotein)
MRRLHAVMAGLAAVLLAALLLAACANPAATLKEVAYGDPTKPYLGMSKQEVLACAGQPHSEFQSGAGGETLTYHYSGAGPVPGEEKKADKKKDDDKQKPKGGLLGGLKKDDDKSWTCTASFVFANDRVVKINFAHRDVNSPYAWQAEADPKKQAEMRNAEVPTCTFSLPRCPRG